MTAVPLNRRAIGESHRAPASTRTLGRSSGARLMFLTVLTYRYESVGPVADPELGLDFSLLVHGEQRFIHHRPVRAGDVLTMVTQLADIRDAGRNEPHATLVSRGTAAADSS
ncbi:MAG: FAS1-like dehydratase domain-containing protein [Mycobacteriales bacterium]